MGNLFSSFNPETTVFWTFGGNWLAALAPLIILPQSFWLLKSNFLKTVENTSNYLIKEISAAINFIAPGTLLAPLSIFFTIVFINFIGLFPYVFTPSSHLRFTAALALPLWLGRMVFRILKQLNHNLAHLVPEGTPRALIPLIVLIETVSLFVRPLALTVRLAANMVAGHLLLTLLGRRGGGNLTIVIGVVAAISLLATLECAVACIQAYVFTILRSLYLNDHTSLKLIKR